MSILLKLVSVVVLCATSVLMLAAYALTLFPWGYLHLATIFLATAYIFVIERGRSPLIVDVVVAIMTASISAAAILPQLLSATPTILRPSIFVFSVVSVGLFASYTLWRLSKRTARSAPQR